MNKTEMLLMDIVKGCDEHIHQGYLFDLNTGDEKFCKKEDVVTKVLNIVENFTYHVEDYFDELLSTIHIHYDFKNNDFQTGKLLVVHLMGL